MFCGGTVYTPATIITAAHCCVEIGNYQSLMGIVGGELDIRIPSGKEQKRKIKSYLQYEDYQPSTITNDICLLFLDKDLELNDDVKRLELNEKETLPEDTECVVSGWGTTYVILK